jgi:hypothetical protein
MESCFLGATPLQDQIIFHVESCVVVSKRQNKTHKKIQEKMVWPYWSQYCLPNNIVLLINVDKFDPNPILVNINKSRP